MNVFWGMAGAAHALQAGAEASGRAREAQSDAKEVLNCLERSLLACEAMWSIMSSATEPARTSR